MEPNVLIIPASPALVPDLAPADAATRRLLSTAQVQLPQGECPIHLVGRKDERLSTGHRGSFRAWGAPHVRVDDGHDLFELVSRYVLGPQREKDIVDVRDRVGELDPSVFTVVCLDGSAGLTQRAPYSLLDNADEADRYCRTILSTPGPHTPLRCEGIDDVELWSELARVPALHKELLESDSSTGVGRYVARWRIE